MTKGEEATALYELGEIVYAIEANRERLQEWIVMLAHAGVSRKRIAEAIGKSESAVAYYLKKKN